MVWFRFGTLNVRNRLFFDFAHFSNSSRVPVKFMNINRCLIYMNISRGTNCKIYSLNPFNFTKHTLKATRTIFRAVSFRQLATLLMNVVFSDISC